MRILDLMVKDLSQWIRDWKASVFLVVMPIGFTLLFGFAFGDVNTEEDNRIPIAYLAEDQGILADEIFNLFSNSDTIRLEIFEDVDRSVLSEQVDKGEFAAAIILPENYSQALRSGDDAQLILIVDAASTSANTLEFLIQSMADRLHNSVSAALISARLYEEQSGTKVSEAFFELAVQRGLKAWEEPPVMIESQAQFQAGAEENAWGENPFAHPSPGMMLQFAIAGLIGAAEIMVLERRSRSLQRLMTTPISRFGILVGHFLAMLFMILLQFIVLTVFGDLALGLIYWSAPLATGLLILTTSLFIASMGLLIGVLANSPEQTVVYSLVPMFVLAGLGGAWMPLEFTSKTFQTIGHLTPTAWAMDGFKNILLRGLGLGGVLLPAAILLGYAVLLFFLALWRFNTKQET